MFNFIKPKKEKFVADSVKGVFGGKSSGSKAAERAAQLSAEAEVRAAEIQQESQREAIAELARQFGISQENIAPFLDTGTRALRDERRASTIEGLNRNLGNIFGSRRFDELTEERMEAVQNHLAAAGLTRSGTALLEAARVPTDVALAIEDELFNRASGLAGRGLNAAVGVGDLGQVNSTSIANLLNQSGASAAAGVRGSANATASGILTGAQADAQNTQNTLNTAATLAGIFFSDPDLKENIEKVGEAYGLSIYQWDWIPESEGTLVRGCSTMGFMADEVEEKYPDFIGEFGGYRTIDYPGLLLHLESKWLH